MDATRQFFKLALATSLALGGCMSGANQAMPGTAQQLTADRGVEGARYALVRPDRRFKCPKEKYTLGCVTIVPTGEGETITFSCDGGYDCPVPKWNMYNSFRTVAGKPADRYLGGVWDPNPYHSGPSTYTINLIHERRALKPSKKVEFVETLIACPAHSSCTSLGTVGIVPEF